jgi:hypothetical protein
MPDEQIVSASDILKAAGADKPVTEGTFLQRTGLILAGCVGGVAAVVILALVGKWVFYAPKPSSRYSNPARIRQLSRQSWRIIRRCSKSRWSRSPLCSIRSW